MFCWFLSLDMSRDSPRNCPPTPHTQTKSGYTRRFFFISFSVYQKMTWMKHKCEHCKQWTTLHVARLHYQLYYKRDKKEWQGTGTHPRTIKNPTLDPGLALGKLSLIYLFSVCRPKLFTVMRLIIITAVAIPCPKSMQVGLRKATAGYLSGYQTMLSSTQK